MYSQFCWSMWFLGLPVVAHIWLGVRIACPGACCIVLCPDIPTDIIEATHFVAKATKVAAGYAFFVAASAAFSSWTSDDLRAECGVRPRRHPPAQPPARLPPSACAGSILLLPCGQTRRAVDDRATRRHHRCAAPSPRLRVQDKKCTGLTESACNKVCGCSESLVVGVG